MSDRGRTESDAWFEDVATFRRLAQDREALTVLAGAFALVIAAVLVNSARPLFGHSGFGLVIALTSCGAAILLSATVLGVSILNRSGSAAVELRRVWRVVGVIVAAATVIAVALDFLALFVTATR